MILILKCLFPVLKYNIYNSIGFIHNLMNYCSFKKFWKVENFLKNFNILCKIKFRFLGVDEF